MDKVADAQPEWQGKYLALPDPEHPNKNDVLFVLRKEDLQQLDTPSPSSPRQCGCKVARPVITSATATGFTRLRTKSTRKSEMKLKTKANKSQGFPP